MMVSFVAPVLFAHHQESIIDWRYRLAWRHRLYLEHRQCLRV